MGIAYEEMEGSPRLTMDRNGGKGTRIIKIDWDDIDAAILELFPGALFGYPYNASMPGFPWLRCQSVMVEPFDPNNPRLSANGYTCRYPQGGAKLTVEYAPNQWDSNEESPGETTNNGETFIEHKTNISGEFLIWPNHGLRWAKGTDDTEWDGSSSSSKYAVNNDIKAGIIIPIIEHETTWNFVRKPPWPAIRRCLGKVNKEEFAGAFKETLLFLGASASRTFSTTGFPWWKLTYKFQEKCYNWETTKEDKEVHGWNHFLRPNGGNTSFQRLMRADKTGIYGLCNFRQLFGGPP